MNFIIFGIVFLILLFWFWPRNIDNEILNGWWYSPTSFNEKSGLDYMFMNMDISGSSLAGYIIAGDSEGLIFNSPIQGTLSSLSSNKLKGKYQINISSKEKLPFPDKSTLIIDRTNCTISIYNEDILYVYMDKYNQ